MEGKITPLRILLSIILFYLDLTQKTGEIINFFTENLDLKERQVKTHLSELVEQGKIVRPERGLYSSVKRQEGVLDV